MKASMNLYANPPLDIIEIHYTRHVLDARDSILSLHNKEVSISVVAVPSVPRVSAIVAVFRQPKRLASPPTPVSAST